MIYPRSLISRIYLLIPPMVSSQMIPLRRIYPYSVPNSATASESSLHMVSSKKTSQGSPMNIHKQQTEDGRAQICVCVSVCMRPSYYFSLQILKGSYGVCPSS